MICQIWTSPTIFVNDLPNWPWHLCGEPHVAPVTPTPFSPVMARQISDDLTAHLLKTEVRGLVLYRLRGSKFHSRIKTILDVAMVLNYKHI
eukprot:1237805-Amphidinium_carterae.1